MLKKLTLILALFSTSFTFVKAQGNVADFKIVDIIRGNETPHENKVMKIATFKKQEMLSVYDFDGDGIKDTLYYRLGTKNNTITATVVWFDNKKDDWITLYSMDIKGLKGTEGLWFFTTNMDENAAPEFVLYTVKTNYKSATVIRYQSAKKAFLATTYALNDKNFFPHKLVVNKRLFRNAKGKDEQTFDELPMKDEDK